MAGFKDFAAGTYLTAQDIDDFIMTQQVMVFGGTAARDAALGTAVRTEGMVAYIGGGSATVYDGSTWKAWP
jgi:hypothetical protein